MPFWNGEALLERLPDLIDPFRESNIDCAAYTLSVGHEIYVSPTDQAVEPQNQTIRPLADREAFTIPAGQFAFLVTEERVRVPSAAIAFISIKAKIKFRGLVNVSGFHVDPGFAGRLVFAVFNAGPVVVHLRRGDPCFLIWYADLNASSGSVKKGPEQTGITTEMINGISGELQSFQGLAKKIKDVEKSLADRVHSIEREQGYYRILAAIVLVLVGVVIKHWLWP